MWGQVNNNTIALNHIRIIPMRVGTSLSNFSISSLVGDHPHACGDKSAPTSIQVRTIGSSPCVWGQEVFLIIKELGIRIIPMRVGTSVKSICKVYLIWDHPHACGDKHRRRLYADNSQGSSPCVWGQVKNSFAIAPLSRIIPMRVGTSKLTRFSDSML